jgi:hypothetical protein
VIGYATLYNLNFVNNAKMPNLFIHDSFSNALCPSVYIDIVVFRLEYVRVTLPCTYSSVASESEGFQ